MDRVLRSVNAMTIAAVLVGLALAAGVWTITSNLVNAHQPPDFTVGATFHGFWNYDSPAEMASALQSLHDAGGTWVRIDVGWAAIETERGVYSSWALAGYDTAIDAAHQEGLNVLLVLQRTPSWANGSDDPALAPHDPAVFGDFALDMANRYAGKVQAIELWNEPNHRQFFIAQEAGQEAREHALMVQDAYTKIKESGPAGKHALTVLAGGSSHVDTSWWRRMYAAGIRDYTDVVAVNPYPMPSDLPPHAEADGSRYRMTELSALIQLMQDQGDGDKPVWFTEFGWSNHGNPPNSSLWERGVSQEQQADFFEDTVTLLETDYPQVTQIFWYNLRDRDDSDSAHQNNFGLLEHDLTPKPVLRRMAEIYVGE